MNTIRLLEQRLGPEEQLILESLLEKYAIFDGLAPGWVGKLVPAFQIKEFRDEEIVCHCPDASHDAFVLLKGTVAVTRKKGEAIHVLQLEGLGPVFNIGPLIGLEKDPAGVRALGSVELLGIDSIMLNRVMHLEWEIGFKLLRNLCRLVMIQNGRILDRYIE